MKPRGVLPLAAALLVLVSIFSMGVSVLADHEPPRGIPSDAESATVREIVDGDTIRITLEDGTKDTVRLIGIDTPETRSPRDPIECFGPESSDRIAKLLPVGREIWLESDRTNRDRFDRLLRYVWVEKSSGGRYLLNEVMVRDGFALAIRYEPDTARAERLEKAQTRAANAGRGLWSACPELVQSLTPVAVAPTPVPQPTEPPFVPQPTQPPPTTNCHPSYLGGCLLPGIGDYDCAGGRGNGPNYTGFVQVVGYDEFGLDGDGDGAGCE